MRDVDHNDGQQHDGPDAVPSREERDIRVSPFRQRTRTSACCVSSTSPGRSTTGIRRSPIRSRRSEKSSCSTTPASDGRPARCRRPSPAWRRMRSISWTACALDSCDVLGFSLGGMVAQQMALDRPSIFRRMILVGTAPRGGEDIMHLEKPSLARHLGDPTLKGYAVLQKIFFAPTSSSQAAGGAFIERLARRTEDLDTRIRTGRRRRADGGVS